MRRAIITLAIIVTALWTAAAVAWAQIIVDTGSDIRPVAQTTPTAPAWRPPSVSVDPDVAHLVDEAEAQAAVTRIVNDPRGWRRHLDEYRIRIVRPGVAGTDPMPGIIGRARAEQGLVIISAEAWTTVGPQFARIGGTLDDQRAWVVLHELGHLLGHHHEDACPTPGAPAPVMRRVTYDIGDCTLNVWPNP